ncbi:MAG: ParB/RepB/Spo0J family partition protein [Anaerovoracaceae bacterium]|jgi:ParB family chromosome partitioning protein
MSAVRGRGLGKGLEALFNNVEISGDDLEDNERINDENMIHLLSINEIKPNSNQPRKIFDEDKIQELSDSIIEHGIIQPIIVRKAEVGYEIIAGERRWRAARKASLKKVPCIVRELDDEQNMLLSIIENMQREDLNPMEEAEALNQMIDQFGLTQEEVSKSVGKSRPYISNALRLLKLPDEVKRMVREGQLSSGHARAIAGIKDTEKQISIAHLIIKNGLSVREVEALARKEEAVSEKKTRAKARAKSRELLVLEENLKNVFGTKVEINHGPKRGKIEIEYYSRDELERLIEMLLALNNTRL